MSALWKQCQQGSSNEGWAKYIQAAALALGFSPAKERVIRVEMERCRLPEQADSRHALNRAERYWRLQDGKFSEACSGSR